LIYKIGMRAILGPVTLVLCTATARADEELVSTLAMDKILLGQNAAEMVACGRRPPEWGAHLHAKIFAALSEHAGSPHTNPHVPSDVERSTALRALERHEAEGRQRGAEEAALGEHGSCELIARMFLSILDDYEDGAIPIWPTR
jgi:hypothetical protein